MKFGVFIAFLIVAISFLIGYAYRGPIFGFIFPPKQDLASSDNNRQNSREQNPNFIAVSIENSPEVRPQAGLSLADLVIETVTEGGITRLLAFYQSREARMIGPVRSARPYFLDWAAGFNAPFVHSGGSKEALEKIKNGETSFKNIDEFFNEKYFWRDPAKKAPHNLFTSTALLRELVTKKGWSKVATPPGWGFKSDEPANSQTSRIREIAIDFSFDPFAVIYRYDEATNSYQRFLGGKLHVDALNDEQIMVKNVIILYTRSSLIDENLLTIDLDILGSGRAVVFRDGGILRTRWRKDTAEAPLKLIDADGSLAELNQGLTWIAVIDQNGSASWK